MANTSKQEIINVFESLIRDKTTLSSSLEDQWVLNAVAQHCADITRLVYDATTGYFDSVLLPETILTLGYYVKLSYLRRQFDYVNKMSRIVTKDLSIDGNDGTKKYTLEELKEELSITQDLISKQTTSYIN